MMVQCAADGYHNGHVLSVVLCSHDPHEGHLQHAVPKSFFVRLVGNALLLRPSDALFEDQRWLKERSRSVVDRAFDEAKRRGIERIFTTFHG